MAINHNITGAAGIIGGPMGPVGIQGPVGVQGAAGIPMTIGAGGVVTSIGYTGGGGGVGGFTQPTISIKASNTIHLNNREPPQGEKFGDSLEMFLLDMRLDGSDANHFHYTVWSKLHRETYPDHGTILRNGLGVVPAFGSASSREHFVTWLRVYEDQFFQQCPIKETMIPTPRSGDVKGVWIEDPPFDADMVDFRMTGPFSSQLTDWVWIVGNCHGAVTRFSNGWLFERDADAIHFKMR